MSERQTSMYKRAKTVWAMVHESGAFAAQFDCGVNVWLMQQRRHAEEVQGPAAERGTSCGGICWLAGNTTQDGLLRAFNTSNMSGLLRAFSKDEDGSDIWIGNAQVTSNEHAPIPPLPILSCKDIWLPELSSLNSKVARASPGGSTTIPRH